MFTLEEEENLVKMWSSVDEDDYYLAMAICREMMEKSRIKHYSRMLAEAKGWEYDTAFTALYNSVIKYPQYDPQSTDENTLKEPDQE